jgi:electron transfer flavoprotein beta subunit
LRIIVCLKQVPDDSGAVPLGADGAWIEEAIAWTLSPLDRHALEEALSLRERHGGSVTVLHVGPDRPPSVLTEGLALGADAAVHLWDESFGVLDACGRARVLAAAIRVALSPFDLILTGQRGLGEDEGQVPGLLAEMLDIPQVTAAVKVELTADGLRAERDVEGGREVWETELPALLSAHKALNVPRQRSLKGVLAAKKKPVQRLDAAAVGLSAAELAPRLRLEGQEASLLRRPVRMLDGAPDAQVRELLRCLRKDGALP